MKRTGFEGMFVTFLFGSSGYRIISRKVRGRWFREISILARCSAVPSNSMKHHFLMPDVQPLRDTKTNNRSPVEDKIVSMNRVDMRRCAVPWLDATAQS
jgi:hypothetical protein